MKLTEAIIKTAEIKPAIYYLWDSDIKGFGVKIIPNGKKKYFLKYRPKNSINQRWYIFGEVGTMKLVTAREEAIKLWGLISSGEDPQADKKEKRTATSLIEFYPLFIKDYVEVIGAKPNYRRSIEYCWNDYIKPALGHKAILDINERDIERIHNALKDKKYTANRVLSLLKLMFNVMERWKLKPVNTNPCQFINKFKEEPRQRYLTLSEVKLLSDALDKVEQDNPENVFSVGAIKLLLLTGARKTEILSARWAWVDFEKGIIQLPDSKTGQKTVYLSPKAVQILYKLKKAGNDTGNPYIIQNVKTGGYIQDIKHLWAKILKIAGINKCRVHDLRHTAASIAISQGHSLSEIAQLLGHASPFTTQRYAHLANNAAMNVANTVNQIVPIS